MGVPRCRSEVLRTSRHRVRSCFSRSNTIPQPLNHDSQLSRRWWYWESSAQMIEGRDKSVLPWGLGPECTSVTTSVLRDESCLEGEPGGSTSKSLYSLLRTTAQIYAVMQANLTTLCAVIPCSVHSLTRPYTPSKHDVNGYVASLHPVFETEALSSRLHPPHSLLNLQEQPPPILPCSAEFGWLPCPHCRHPLNATQSSASGQHVPTIPNVGHLA